MTVVRGRSFVRGSDPVMRRGSDPDMRRGSDPVMRRGSDPDMRSTRRHLDLNSGAVQDEP